MQFQQKTLGLIEAVNAILEEYAGPLTLRQVYYRLVAAHTIANRQQEYKRLSRTLVKARLAGLVDDTRIVDRVRTPFRVSCWDDLRDFLETVRRAYRREKWTSQRFDVQVWCEKDAVAGVLQPITDEFEVTLYPCRGYNSYSALKEAGRGINGIPRPTVILYLGDFDPSGQDMPRDIRRRLTEDFGADFDLRVIALTREQIDEHQLPPDLTKKTDTRAAAFIARHGDMAVELDAPPPNVLQALVREHLALFVGKSAFEAERAQEAAERAELAALIDAVS